MHRPDIFTFFAQHHWVASAAELHEKGIDDSAIYRARKLGLVRTPIRGTVVVGDVELTFEGRARLAQLAGGVDAFVSGPSAGVIRGLRGMSSERIEVTVPERSRLSLPTWIRVVRTSWIGGDRDVEVRDDGIRVATPLRMLFGLAAQFNQHRFERAAEDVWHKKLVSPDDAREYLEMVRRSGRTGVQRMNTWLEKTAATERPAQSGLELDLVALIARAGLPAPKRQHPLVLTSGELIHLDLAWPEIRLAVEPGHSWWHGGDLRQRRDQARDRGCSALGWLVVRYDENARRDRATARELAAIYRQRAG